MVVSAVRYFALRRHRGMKISIRRSLAIMVGASVLFSSGALIDAEAPSGKRHDEMVASFNRGYLSFQSYRICTSVADVVVRRYLEEGAKIARDITARYAN